MGQNFSTTTWETGRVIQRLHLSFWGVRLHIANGMLKTRQSTANHVRVMSNAWILSHSMLTVCSHGHCQKVCTPKNKAFLIVCLGLWSGSQFPKNLVIETVNLSGNCFPVNNWTYFYLLVAVRRKGMLSLLRPECYAYLLKGHYSLWINKVDISGW